MPNKTAQPSLIWRCMRGLNPRAVQNFRRGVGPKGLVLVLTTTGRKTGRLHQTPLQYEVFDGAYYIASARGAAADWFRNLQACPQAEIDVEGRSFPVLAETVTDPSRIADFLEKRLQKHPWMIGGLMRLEGLPWRYNRADLERFAADKALAILYPGAGHEISRQDEKAPGT